MARLEIVKEAVRHINLSNLLNKCEKEVCFYFWSNS